MAGKINLQKLDGTKLHIGIARSLWHGDMTEALMEQVVRALRDCGVPEKNIVITDVPGSYELVFGAKTLIEKQCDAVIALGVLLKGDTMHFEYIADAVAQGLMRLNTDTRTPVLFGVLTCLTKKQAHERSLGKKSHGYDWGLSLVHMAHVKKYMGGVKSR